MENYYTYLPTSAEDEKWGMTLLNTGCGQITGSLHYPVKKHPAPYQFHWQQGRLLQEYQLIYISQGEGVFESRTAGSIDVVEGSIIILFPGEWHRYRPNSSTGWIEYWIGFKGKIADTIFQNSFYNRKQPVLTTGVRPDIIKLFQDIIDQARSELPGYQPLVGGMVVHLLGLIYAVAKQQGVSRDDAEHKNLVQRAMVLIRENIETGLTPEDFADKLQIGYSLFRKIFKQHTGLAPGQYLIQLKIERAKSDLLSSDKLVKEIAYDLNFQSEYYFSKFFKEKTGLSPLAFRKRFSL